MQVFLEAIKFNHDPESATTDAFGIRKNETEAIRPPEWRRLRSLNPEDSPAAFARNKVRNQILTIKARFSCDRSGEKIWIRALDGKSCEIEGSPGFPLLAAVLKPLSRRFSQGNVLGQVRATQVDLLDAQSHFVSFELQNVRIQQVGVGIDDIIWHWQFSRDGWNWCPITTTRHRIYTVVDLPGHPWNPNSDSSNTQLPWTSVLDRACRWSAGTTDLQSAAFQITKAINSLGPDFIRYDLCNRAYPHFCLETPARFDCQRFLNVLNSDPSRVQGLVDCDDCAAMVCTFANVLGCSFPESRIISKKSELSLRRHQKIGLDWDDFDQFDNHVIAWAGRDQDPVSDACLKLDDSDSDSPTPLIASNLPFAGQRGYKERLLVSGEDCHLKEQFSRQIGLSTRSTPQKHSVVKPQALSLVDAFTLLAIDNWTRIELRYVPEDTVESYWEMEGPNTAVLRLDIQVSATKEDADENLMQKLGRFEMPGMKRKENAEFGDDVFADQSGLVILFSRNHLVSLLRNVGTGLVPLLEVAKILDKFLSGLPTINLNG